jgi:hypothetical protein
MAELKRDEEEVAEIESCDQEYLNELKTSLAEQRYELIVFILTWRLIPVFVQCRVGCVSSRCLRGHG